jgi:hypothetical protein
MTIYITPDNKLHDDEDGFALSLPSWPQDAVLATQEQIDAITNPPETAEQIIARLESALDRHLDEVAKEYRYESIRTMVTYATSEHPIFGREGRAAVKYRDYVYNYGIEKIYACTREVDPEPIPTEAQLLDGLPPFEDFLEPLAA